MGRWDSFFSKLFFQPKNPFFSTIKYFCKKRSQRSHLPTPYLPPSIYIYIYFFLTEEKRRINIYIYIDNTVVKRLGRCWEGWEDWEDGWFWKKLK
jgi:hypothetical protein